MSDFNQPTPCKRWHATAFGTTRAALRDKSLISKFDVINFFEESSFRSSLDFTEIENAINTNSRLREHVIQAFLDASFPSVKKKESLKLLQANENLKQIEFAKNLISKAKTSKEKSDGIFLLLGSPAYISKNQDYFRKNLLVETKQEVLQPLLFGIQSGQTPDANIRETAIQVLARWDKEGSTFTNTISRSMFDSDINVRFAEIGAVSIFSPPPSGLLKNHLMKIAANNEEGEYIKAAATSNVNLFMLDQKEYGLYRSYLNK